MSINRLRPKMKMAKSILIVKITSIMAIFMFLIIESNIGEAVKMIGIKVPAFIYIGDSVQLFCDYDMQMDTLYSVTWYKDNEEFYRYVPSSSPLDKHSFNMDGITVDKLHSDNKRVTLISANLLMNGEYKCEVSAEAPFFSSVHAESKMAIISIPKKDLPEINGGSEIYQSDDTIYLNCTSAKSYPAAKLRWYINDKIVISNNDRTEKLPNGLYVSISKLNLPASPDRFHNGMMKVTCRAVISIGRPKALPPPWEYKRDAILLVRGSAVAMCITFNIKVTLIVLTFTVFLINTS
ncbi:Immunoglobulin-like domain,Immunoglobulin-like fold,CD80-like, immunoglobulin C2-set [Cinara cedri]|uniref:Immunoglobulin-like domain,Immunoglobulin-like fold,CD80-like, immunoglobulin C2-set n=1 Tax=Cinara cedri TaxID=506608 RepID=A0A5E4N0A1_9HEMI|nr:Immunoglobulin-like domain,Immunoglobulin-like fold,CD80-like, immunoglobulin C2-set [Cinara cedri]